MTTPSTENRDGTSVFVHIMWTILEQERGTGAQLGNFERGADGILL